MCESKREDIVRILRLLRLHSLVLLLLLVWSDDISRRRWWRRRRRQHEVARELASWLS